MSDDVELSASRSCLFVRAEWGEIEHFSMNLLMTKRSVVEEVMNIHFSCTAQHSRFLSIISMRETFLSLFVLYDPNGHL